MQAMYKDFQRILAEHSSGALVLCFCVHVVNVLVSDLAQFWSPQLASCVTFS